MPKVEFIKPGILMCQLLLVFWENKMNINIIPSELQNEMSTGFLFLLIFESVFMWQTRDDCEIIFKSQIIFALWDGADEWEDISL